MVVASKGFKIALIMVCNPSDLKICSNVRYFACKACWDEESNCWSATNKNKKKISSFTAPFPQKCSRFHRRKVHHAAMYLPHLSLLGPWRCTVVWTRTACIQLCKMSNKDCLLVVPRCVCVQTVKDLHRYHMCKAAGLQHVTSVSDGRFEQVFAPFEWL